MVNDGEHPKVVDRLESMRNGLHQRAEYLREKAGEDVTLSDCLLVGGEVLASAMVLEGAALGLADKLTSPAMEATFITMGTGMAAMVGSILTQETVETPITDKKGQHLKMSTHVLPAMAKMYEKMASGVEAIDQTRESFKNWLTKQSETLKSSKEVDVRLGDVVFVGSGILAGSGALSVIPVVADMISPPTSLAEMEARTALINSSLIAMAALEAAAVASFGARTIEMNKLDTGEKKPRESWIYKKVPGVDMVNKIKPTLAAMYDKVADSL